GGPRSPGGWPRPAGRRASGDSPGGSRPARSEAWATPFARVSGEDNSTGASGTASKTGRGASLPVALARIFVKVCARRGSGPAEEEIEDHATGDMRAWTAEVVEQRLLRATGLLECVGQDGHALEVVVLVDPVGQRQGGRTEPGRVEVEWAEWVA